MDADITYSRHPKWQEAYQAIWDICGRQLIESERELLQVLRTADPEWQTRESHFESTKLRDTRTILNSLESRGFVEKKELRHVKISTGSCISCPEFPTVWRYAKGLE